MNGPAKILQGYPEWLFKKNPFGKVDAMTNKDKIPYLMLFCGLLLMQRRGVTMNDILAAVPLTGNAKNLACEIATQELIANSSN